MIGGSSPLPVDPLLNNLVTFVNLDLFDKVVKDVNKAIALFNCVLLVFS